MERAPAAKPDEQFPLLKLESGGGGGDIGGRQQAPTAAIGWTVTCVPKKCWLSRWPELLSTCWMTFVLVAVTFMIFYALGMTFKRQQMVILNCNDTEPGRDVFLHHIVYNDNYIHFSKFSSYLASISQKYPSLHFHIYFMIDDSLNVRNKFFIKLLSFYPNKDRLENIEKDKEEIKKFERNFTNVNVTILPLSVYMAMTPLRYKWRTAPLSCIPFYTRVFSVWQNGGIAIDLTHFNDKFNRNRRHDDRITKILEQHEDGVSRSGYYKSLPNNDKHNGVNEWQIFSLLNDVFDEFRTMVFKSLNPPTTARTGDLKNLLKRLHRNKRGSNDTKEMKLTKSTISVENVSPLLEHGDKEMKSVDSSTVTDPKQPKKSNDSNVRVADVGTLNNRSVEYYVKQPMLFYYDFPFSDEIGPSYLFPEPFVPPIAEIFNIPTNSYNKDYLKPNRETSPTLYNVVIDREGMLVSATSKEHPLLGYLVTAGCKNPNPRVAIEVALRALCPGTNKDSAACKIFVINL